MRGFDIYPIHKRLQRYLGNLDIGTVRPKQGSSDGQRKTSKIIILHFFFLIAGLLDRRTYINNHNHSFIVLSRLQPAVWFGPMTTQLLGNRSIILLSVGQFHGIFLRLFWDFL